MSSNDLQNSDIVATRFAILTAVVIIAHQVAGKATRDALFLTHFDVTDLPKAVILGAVCSIGAVMLISRLMTRRGPARVIPLAFALSALLFVLEWYLLDTAPRLVAMALYLHMSMFGAALISGFWSVFNERFDPHSAKLIVARIAAAATLGGLAGGLIAERVSAFTDIRTVLLVLGAAHLASMFTLLGMARSATDSPPAQPVEQGMSGIQALRQTPYLQRMGLLLVLGAVAAALLDYALKSEAAARFTSSESLIGFFAMFYAISGGAAFVLQTTLGKRALKRLGLGGTIALVPATVMITGFIGVSLTNIWTVVVLRGAQTAMSNSFFRSGFELLYSPVAREKKRAAKSIIDVGADRLGDMLGGGLILLLLLLIPDLPTSLVIGLAIIVAGLALLVIRKLKQGYVSQLATSLRNNQAEVTADVLIEPSAGLTATEAEPGTKWQPARATGSVQIGAPVTREAAPAALSDSMLTTISDLRSNDPVRMRNAINASPLNPLLVSHIIPLLGYAELAQEAQQWLEGISVGIEGELADALLNPGYLPSVHLHLTEVLENIGSQRALYGLLSGLQAKQYALRHACAMSLHRLTAAKPELDIPSRPVLIAVQFELEAENNWAMVPVGANTKGLEHIFSLLALTQEREVMDSCYQALAGSDRTLHGTALEYLENVLPDEIRILLWRHIEGTAKITRSNRDQQELADRLLNSGRGSPPAQHKASKPASEQPKPPQRHTVISLYGEIDLAVAPMVSKQFLEIMGQGKNLVVDFSQVSYIDSSGISSLVEGHQYAQSHGLEFALAGLGEVPMRVLQLCNMDQIFTIYQSPNPPE